MNELNFFAPFQTGKSRSRTVATKKVMSVLPIITSVVAVVMLIVVPAATFGYGFVVNQKLTNIQNTLSLPENVIILQKLDAAQLQLDAISQAIPVLQGKDQQLTSLEWINENTIQVIKDTIPKQITVNMMALKEHVVQIDGTALDRPALSEMEYALRQSGIADDISVATIFKDANGTFNFSMSFTLNTTKAKDVKPQ